MGTSSQNKSEFLGMPFGTASARLRKQILFYLLVKHNENICYRCSKLIEDIADLSIEHKEPWQNISIKLFWNINNIGFSHLSCNVKARDKTKVGENQRIKTHCPKGHEYTKENTYTWKNMRDCRICTKERITKLRKNKSMGTI